MKTCIGGALIRNGSAGIATKEMAGRVKAPVDLELQIAIGDRGGVFLQAPTTGRGPERRFLTRDHLTVAVDGIIDDREALFKELALERELTRDIGCLVLAAYNRWGRTFATKLRGDFAIVLLDERAGVLLGVVDPFSLRQLYFQETADATYVASQLRQLPSVANCSSSDLDGDYVADFLANPVGATNRTPFRTVRRVPGGHVLNSTMNGSSLRRYWEWSQAPRSTTRKEAASDFQELFTRAVSRRMSERTCANLSGGLDSSSIVATAAGLAAGEAGPRLSVHSSSELTSSEERTLIAALLKATGISHRFQPMRTPFFSSTRLAIEYMSEPSDRVFWHGAAEAEAEALRSVGATTLIAGHGAEAVVLLEHQEPIHLSSYLRRGSIGRFLREIHSWQEAWRIPYLNVLFDYGLGPLVRPFGGLPALHRYAPWLRKDYVKAKALAERAHWYPGCEQRAAPEHRFQSLLLNGVSKLLYRGFLEWHADLRYPFLDVDLVQSTIRLPWEVRMSAGEDKHLLRVAMEGVLPDEVRLAAKQSSDLTALHKGFALNWPTFEPLVREPALADLGSVEPSAFYEAALDCLHGGRLESAAFFNTLALEVWIDEVFGLHRLRR